MLVSCGEIEIIVTSIFHVFVRIFFWIVTAEITIDAVKLLHVLVIQVVGGQIRATTLNSAKGKSNEILASI